MTSHNFSYFQCRGCLQPNTFRALGISLENIFCSFIAVRGAALLAADRKELQKPIAYIYPRHRYCKYHWIYCLPELRTGRTFFGFNMEDTY